MSHPGEERFTALVERVCRQGMTDPGDERWPALLGDTRTSAAFVEWATFHPKWCHDVADVAEQVCAKPLEAAAAILAGIAAESLEE
ncbi:MAG: hypothetical protein ACRBN8_14015 [Nannocystales bacterium]